MMSDIFVEYMVKKQNTAIDYVLRALIIVGGVILATLLFYFSGAFGIFSSLVILAAIGALYGTWYLVTNMSVEYEYTVTNGEMDVDKIMARRKRRRLITVKCSAFEGFGRYNPKEHVGKDYQTVLKVCDSDQSKDLHYCIVRHATMGLTLVVFNANQKMLDAMKAFVPKQLAYEFYVKQK